MIKRKNNTKNQKKKKTKATWKTSWKKRREEVALWKAAEFKAAREEAREYGTKNASENTIEDGYLHPKQT